MDKKWAAKIFRVMMSRINPRDEEYLALKIGADVLEKVRKPRIHKANIPPRSNVWREWVDANRATGRADPAPVGKNLAAGREFGKLIPDETARRAILARFLADGDRFLIASGHALSLLPGRLDAYRNKQVKPRSEWTEADYEQDFLDSERAAALAKAGVK